MNLLRASDSIIRETESFLSGAYPDFVTRIHAPQPDTLNAYVFMFHSVRPDTFENQLQHLSRNGYRTLDTEEYIAFMEGRLTPTTPSVMLTFDDGERSLYEVAYPLLKKYGMKAVNFLVTGRVLDSARERPATGKHWVTWDEVLEMHRSGVVDFQSHTLLHETMFVADTLQDFMRPGLFSDSLLVDRPMIRCEAREELLLTLGAPIYTMAPRMTDHQKFFDREDIRAACIQHVGRHGGVDFFGKADWRDELKAVWRKAKGDGPSGVMEDVAAQRRAILHSLRSSRTQLEDRLNRSVHHLAYPWAQGGDLAVELSKEAGYRSNYWGVRSGHPSNRPGQDPFYLVRLKDDYLLRLPGKGRTSLKDILMMKVRRRAGQSDIY